MRIGWMRGIAGAVLLAAAGNALAWGREGHQIVAEVAMQRLTPAVRAQVERLLALEPGSTLASISTWADEVRSPSTAAWHYVNFRQGQPCEYEPSLCPDDQCVVAAIERQAAVLAAQVPDAQRLKALKYIVHFVADVHQPLHAGFLEDRGGNRHQVQAFGRGTNLHALWDTGLIEHWQGGHDALIRAVDRGSRAQPEADQPETDNADPGQWAEASCRIASTPGFYPDGHELGERYTSVWRQALVEQLARAADRLGQVLSSSLGGRDR